MFKSKYAGLFEPFIGIVVEVRIILSFVIEYIFILFQWSYHLL